MNTGNDIVCLFSVSNLTYDIIDSLQNLAFLGGNVTGSQLLIHRHFSRLVSFRHIGTEYLDTVDLGCGTVITNQSIAAVSFLSSSSHRIFDVHGS